VGFIPEGRDLSTAEFKNSTNINVSEIVKAPNLEGSHFTGSKKPDETPVTKADFEAAITAQSRGPKAAPKLSQLNTASF
jgi:hypothetical protein